MSNKSFLLFIGLIFIAEGILGLLGIKVLTKYQGWIIHSNTSSILFIITGIAFIILRKNIKNKQEYSICPQCEESFNYSELKDEMCPYCNIKTENLEGYYNKEKTNKVS